MKMLGAILSIALLLAGCTSSQPPHSSSQNSGQTSYSESTTSVSTNSELPSSQSASSVPANSELPSSQSASSVPANSELPSSQSASSAPANSELSSSQSASPASQPPPEQLIFHSYESFLELYSVLEKSDKEIEEYLELHNHAVNGMRTRKDIESILARVSATLLPVLESVGPSSITIRSDNVDVIYSFPDNVSYRFIVSKEPAFSSERIKALHANGLLLNEGNDLLLERGNPIDGIAIYGYIGDEDDKKYNRQIFVMDVRGTQINVMVFRADGIDAAIDGLITFEYKTNAFTE